MAIKNPLILFWGDEPCRSESGSKANETRRSKLLLTLQIYKQF